MSDSYGLIHRQTTLLESPTYLGGETVGQSLSWRTVGAADCITQHSEGTSTVGDTPVMLTLVGVGTSSEWYNKLSGLGDYNDEHPHPFSKLKWLIHFKPPVNTIFMKDWDRGVATLQRMQELISIGEPNDLLVWKKKGMFDIRTTKHMFIPKVSVVSSNCTFHGRRLDRFITQKPGYSEIRRPS